MKKEINLAPLWQVVGKAGYDRDKEESCKEAVQAVLDEAQTRCRERLVTVDLIFRMLREVETRLGISKTAMHGITVHCDPFAQQFPGTYKGIPMTTVFQARYYNYSWRLTNVYRTKCSPGRKYMLNLTPLAKETIITKASYFD